MGRGTVALERTVGVGRLVAPLIYPDVEREEERSDLRQVLERAAQDPHFIAALTERPEEALKGYRLTAEDKAALLSGDIAGIERAVGRLDARLRTWLECRLQQEIW